VRNGLVYARNAEESLLGFFYTLSDSGWNFFSLAVANTNHAIAVSDNNQCGEAKATTTLNHLGNAVDSYHTLQELALGFFAVATLVLWATLAAATTGLTLTGFNNWRSNYCFGSLGRHNLLLVF
jgi:hypothetical protein